MPQGFDGRVSENGIPLRYGENMPFGFDGRMSPQGIPLRAGENMPDAPNPYQQFIDTPYRGIASSLGAPIDILSSAMRPFGYDTPEEDVVMGSEWMGKKMEEMGLISQARNPVSEFIAAMMIPDPTDIATASKFLGAALMPSIAKRLGDVPIKPTKTISDLKVENKSTYPKIPTKNVFYHADDYYAVPREKRLSAEKFMDTPEKLPTKEIDLKSIVPTQKNVTAQNIEDVQKAKSFDEPIVAVEHEGKYYLLDGHHRTTSSIMRGDSKIEAKVYQE